MPYALTPEARVHTYANSRQSAPQSIALRDGGYITVWSGAGEPDQGYGVYLQRFDAAGVRVGGETLINTTTAYSQRNPQITLLANGGYAIIWDGTVPGGGAGDPAALGVFVQVFDVSGNRVGPETQVSTGGSSQQLTALPGGGFVVTWTHAVDYPFSGVSARIYDAAGLPRGGAFALDDDQIASLSSVTATDTGFIAVWRANNPGEAVIAVQAYDAGGARIGAPLRIPRDGAQTTPEIVRLTDGGFAVVWAQTDGLYGQLLASDGRTSGDRFLVQTAPGGAQLLHTVVATPDGGFTVAWEQFAGPSSSSIAVGAFFADGSRNGQTLVVASGLGTPGEPPGLAVLPNGDVVVSYARYVGDVTNFYDVFQVRLQSLPNAITGSAADDYLTGAQGADRLTGNDGHDILMGLSGNDVLIGGRGDDRLDGGAGWDEAVFSGLSSRYKIFETPDGRYEVRGLDGNDILTGIEILRFDDRTIDLTRIICNPVSEPSSTTGKPAPVPPADLEDSPLPTTGFDASLQILSDPRTDTPAWDW
ncbi:calcium-binding protein [Brevundimonas sp.]|uniref:calcium-binding protein n=1 Tax=Brevundimonas sp. TaxID=1871086 RepID=UPI003D0F959B